jgi:hypothetical protein
MPDQVRAQLEEKLQQEIHGLHASELLMGRYLTGEALDLKDDGEPIPVETSIAEIEQRIQKHTESIAHLKAQLGSE